MRTHRRPLLTPLLVILALVLLAACGSGPATSTPTTAAPTTAASPTATPTTAPAPATATPTTEPATPTATPTAAATATPAGSPVAGGPLTIEGARVTQIVVPDPSGDAEYAVTADSLYRRVDGDWTRVADANDTWVLADPTQPDVVYRGDHIACARGGDPIPFQKSTDGGRTWQTLPAGESVQPLVIDPANPSHIYGSSCALAISTDGGQTWTDAQPVPSFNLGSLALTGTQLFGIYTSEGGTSYLVASDVTMPENPDTSPTLLEFWGGGVVAAAGDRVVVGESNGVHVSEDGGQTWSFSRDGLEEVTLSVNALTQPIPQEEQARGFGIFAIAVDPAAPARIYAGTIAGLYVSTDSGATWARVPDIGDVRVRDLSFARNGALLYATTDDGTVVLETT